MYRLLSRRIVPVAALGTLYTSKQTSFTCHAKQAAPNPDAKSEKFVTDKFETIKYWNDYKKIIIYGYHGCPYCAKGNVCNEAVYTVKFTESITIGLHTGGAGYNIWKMVVYKEQWG